MQPDIQKYLYDIAESIASIESYLGEKHDFTIYQQSKVLRRAIEREIEIIGEAVNRILKIHPEIEISSARRIVDLRNLVIHSYDAVDDVIMWGVIIKHLPLLAVEIQTLLHDSE